MKKVIKILLIVFVILLAFTYISSVHASGVNMDLPNDTDSTTYGSTPSTANATNNTTVGGIDNTLQNSSVVVSNTAESALDTLTMSDMINIVLCAIGVILILLGIAIIIRQKSV